MSPCLHSERCLEMSQLLHISDRFSNYISRAKLFRRDHSSVTDIPSLYRLMRSNNFLTDSLSEVPGCNGSIPAAAVSNRGDLHPSTTSCSWVHLDYMVGHRPYGAIDTKIAAASSVEDMRFLAVAGPTTEGGWPPFSWMDSGFGRDLVPDYRPIDKWNFTQEWVDWATGEEVPR